MKALMKVRFRTSLALISIAAAMALTSGFVVSFGAARLFQVSVTNYPLLPAFVLLFGIAGVMLVMSKGKALPPFFNQELPGYVALAPIAVLIAITAYFRAGLMLGFFLLALPCALYAIRDDEPALGKETHDLNDFFGAGVLFLFGVLGFIFPFHDPFIPPAVALAAALIVAPAAAYVCWRAPAGRRAKIARASVGAVLVAIAFLAYIGAQPLYAIVYLPTGLLLLLQPWLGTVRMGGPSEPDLNDENIVVNQFEKMAELTVWSVYIFTLIHAYFDPPGPSGALFGLFIAGFVIFTFEYEMLSARHATYEFIQKKSIANAILLGFISHLTGGFQSPYAWFFILVLVSGAFVPSPKMILRRLYVIVAYYVLETAYSYHYGSLNQTLIVDHLMVQVFGIGLTGVYAYRLALRRRQIDVDLMTANDGLKAALEGERAAKAVVEKQSAQMAQAKRRNEDMLESLADGVIGLGADGAISFLNAAAEGLIGRTAQEARGQRIRALVALRCDTDPDFHIADYIDSALNGNAIPLPENVYLLRPDGAKIYISGMAVPIFDERKRPDGAILVLQDISYVREVDQMKTGFLSVAAHQLRTPLSTIRWFLELLIDPSEGKLKKNQRMFAENAYLSLRKMVGLVNRLLAVTRLEGGRVPFKPEPTDLKALTKDILESLKQKLSERKLDIALALPDLPTVPLDPTLAREVFVNLIENAIRYTPDGGKIAIEARDEGDEIVWSVTDTGIGIPKAQQEKIFEKFYRAANAVEHTSEGSGLGLYLAKFIVDAWGGEIGFTSEEGKGATFRVTVPKSGMKAKTGNVSLNA
ncbi:MAG TPA: ATP-binding protein [Candidatus Baltobacteraceae bacterium]|nr:ATP-binding protein [Candidatus Baltobacteraceae bacterium]